MPPSLRIAGKETAGRPPSRSTRRRRVPALLAAGTGGVLFAVQPSNALAVPRPPWSPGPPWAPLAPLSPEMHLISNLFWEMLILSAIIFFGIVGVIIYCAVHFRARPGREEAPQIYGNRTLEIGWTAVPFLILVVAFGFTVHGIHEINTPPAGGKLLDIEAVGHQWWWEFRYRGLGVVTADEVHAPTGVPLHFHVESDDVIHSFWAPQIQRQIDANPGQDNAVYTILDKPGVYAGDCYEYCGAGHAWMKFRFVVESPAQFKAWVKHELADAAKPHGGLAAAGEKVFLSNTCVNCHAIAGTPAGGAVGPNLTHIASRWTIGAGAAPMTASALEAWIRDPSTFKPGVNMPPYPLLSNQDLRALTAYLMSLK